MPSSYSASCRFNLQATGENLNTWGTNLNTGALALIDTAIAGAMSFSLSGTRTLTSANGSTDESRNAILNITGGTGGTITIPSVSKLYVVLNASAGDVILTTGGATNATVKAGEKCFVACDASAVKRVQGTDFGGSRLTNVGYPSASTDAASKQYADDLAFTANAGILPAQTGNAGAYLTTNGTTGSWTPFGSTAAQIWAGTSLTTAFTPGGYKTALAPLALGDSANITPDLSASKRFTLTKGTNGTLSLPIHTFPGDIFEIYITQDGTGSRTMSYASGYRRPSGAVPLSTAAAARDKFIGVVEAVDGSGTATDVTYNLLRNLVA